MKFRSIVDSGCSNILRWAIEKGADVKNDIQLQAIVNDETFFHVTITDVNFFELFRLTQAYRDKLKIIEEYPAEVPSKEELSTYFKGEEENVPLSEYAHKVTENFMNLALQMSNDSDIIKSSAVRLFLPMITRRFTVVFPVSFTDLVNSITVEEAKELFTTDYPATLQDIVTKEDHSFRMAINFAFIKATWILKYNKRFDQYVKITKYSPLSNETSDKLYKVGLLGLYKYNNISRGETRFNLFNATTADEPSEKTLSRIAKLKTPLQVEFAIELPIQYMQILENTFSQDVLKINYESSMTNIIDNSIRYNDFILPEYDEEEENTDEYTAVKNEIEAYRVRIAEANQLTLNAITVLLNNNGEDGLVDTTKVFSMLPSIYTTRAVVTINTENLEKYGSCTEPLLIDMFNDMFDIINQLFED